MQKLIIIAGVTTLFLVGCALVPSKFTAGMQVDERFRQTGYSAGLQWDLKPRHVVNEDYVSASGGTNEGDMP